MEKNQPVAESFKTSDNKNLIIHHFQPEETPEKVMLVVHGHGEHGMRFAEMAVKFTSRNLACSILTLRGHGLSDGKRGHAPSMSQLILDIEYFIRQVRLRYMEADFFLYGHSMGGNIILNYLLRDQSNEIKAGIATSPWIKLGFEPPKWKTTLGGFMANIIPTYTEKSGLDAKEISSIPEEVERYEQDGLIHNAITAKLFSEIQKGGDQIYKQLDKLNHPVLLVHGALDKITSHEASEALVQQSGHFKWFSFANSKHEIHHDVEALQLIEMVCVFVNED